MTQTGQQISLYTAIIDKTTVKSIWILLDELQPSLQQTQFFFNMKSVSEVLQLESFFVKIHPHCLWIRMCLSSSPKTTKIFNKNLDNGEITYWKNEFFCRIYSLPNIPYNMCCWCPPFWDQHNLDPLPNCTGNIWSQSHLKPKF